MKPQKTIDWDLRLDQGLFGIVLPLLILWPALAITLSQTGWVVGRGGLRMEIHGFDATLQGSALACVSTYLHFNRFWKTVSRLERFHRYGEQLSIAGFSITSLWLIARLFVGLFESW